MIQQKYKANSREEVVTVANQILQDRELEPNFNNYLQTDDLIHLYLIGHKVKEEGVYDEDGNEITPPVMSDYVLFDVMAAEERQLDYFKDFEAVEPVIPIHEWGVKDNQ